MVTLEGTSSVVGVFTAIPIVSRTLGFLVELGRSFWALFSGAVENEAYRLDFPIYDVGFFLTSGF